MVAILYLNAVCLTPIQQVNSIDVDNVNFIQVQSRRLSAPLDFRAQIGEVRTSKLTGRTNSSPVILSMPSDSQRRCWHPNPSVRNGKGKTIYNAFNAEE